MPFRDGGQSRKAWGRQGKVFVWQLPQGCFQVGAPQPETLKAGAQGSVSVAHCAFQGRGSEPESLGKAGQGVCLAVATRAAQAPAARQHDQKDRQQFHVLFSLVLFSGWGATAGDFGEGRCARQCVWHDSVAHCAFQGRGSEPESLGKAGQGVCLAVTTRAAQAPAARQHDQKDRQQFHVLFSLVLFSGWGATAGDFGEGRCARQCVWHDSVAHCAFQGRGSEPESLGKAGQGVCLAVTTRAAQAPAARQHDQKDRQQFHVLFSLVLFSGWGATAGDFGEGRCARQCVWHDSVAHCAFQGRGSEPESLEKAGQGVCLAVTTRAAQAPAARQHDQKDRQQFHVLFSLVLFSGWGATAGDFGEGRCARQCFWHDLVAHCAFQGRGSEPESLGKAGQGVCLAVATRSAQARLHDQKDRQQFHVLFSGWGATAGDFEGRCARQCVWHDSVAHCAFQGRGSEPESLGKAGQGVCLAVTTRAAQAPAARQHNQKDRQQFHVLFSLVLLSGWGATAGDFGEGRCARQCFWPDLVAHCAFQGRGSEPESLGKAGQGVCLAVATRSAQARQHDQKDRQQFHVLFSLVLFSGWGATAGDFGEGRCARQCFWHDSVTHCAFFHRAWS